MESIIIENKPNKNKFINQPLGKETIRLEIKFAIMYLDKWTLFSIAPWNDGVSRESWEDSKAWFIQSNHPISC